jgi:hypothetical protein
LIEAAEKAAGYTWREDVAKEREALGVVGLWIPGVKTAWNPLINDGDALRLASKLCMQITCYPWGAQAQSCDALDRDNPYAATRRAIVKAAAEISQMQGI